MPVSFRADDEDAGARCAALVARGRTVNADPRPEFGDCAAVVLPALAGLPQAVSCARVGCHDGLHRSYDGHTWLHGAEDFTPSVWPGSGESR